jgi:hypothetical protein
LIGAQLPRTAIITVHRDAAPIFFRGYRGGDGRLMPGGNPSSAAVPASRMADWP